MENSFEEITEKKTRPTLLTVLCILTFIAAGFSILAYLVTSFLPGSFSNGMEEQFAQMFGEEKAAEMVATMAQSIRIAPYMLVLSILNLTGAILMFQLKRIGYFLYIIAQVGMVVLPAFISGNWGIVWSAIWALLFIILYGLNWKYFK